MNIKPRLLLGYAPALTILALFAALVVLPFEDRNPRTFAMYALAATVLIAAVMTMQVSLAVRVGLKDIGRVPFAWHLISTAAASIVVLELFERHLRRLMEVVPVAQHGALPYQLLALMQGVKLTILVTAAAIGASILAAVILSKSRGAK